MYYSMGSIMRSNASRTGPRWSSRFTILRSGVRQSIESIVSCAAWMSLAKTTLCDGPTSECNTEARVSRSVSPHPGGSRFSYQRLIKRWMDGAEIGTVATTR
jgi:hypothetical protein